jgi:large subunit ribosomal protein L16
MLLMPKRVKFRKTQKGKSRGVATTGAQMHFGEFGLKALEKVIWTIGSRLSGAARSYSS